MYRWLYFVAVFYGVLFVMKIGMITTPVYFDQSFKNNTILENRNFPKKKLASMKDWNSCPSGDGSLESVFVSAFYDMSGLGNQVWAYLSVWALARRYGVRPVLPEYTLNRMSEVFDRRYFQIPTLSEIGAKCNLLPWILDEYNSYNFMFVNKLKHIQMLLQTPLNQSVSMIKFDLYVTDATMTIPLWNELGYDLVIKKELQTEANRRLQRVRQEFFIRNKNDPEYKNMTLENIQFVAAHIRRSDYLEHMKIVYPNASAVEPDFYKNAFAWLKKQISSPLVFIIITDDMVWAEENVAKNKTDVFMPGNGKYDDPGLDMALLAACNHSVLSYGTFGLTGALLANGDYTVVYDTGNKSVTKEMQFASVLPGWYIMDNKGQLQYQKEVLEPTFYATN